MTATPTVPYRLTIPQVEHALEQLGIPTKDLTRLELRGRGIRVEHVRRDGKRFFVVGDTEPDEVAVAAHDIEVGPIPPAERRAAIRARLRTARRTLRWTA